MVDSFKCLDSFKGFNAGREYKVVGATDTGIVLQDDCGTEYPPEIFTEIVEHFDISRVNLVEIILSLVMYSDVNVKVIGSALHNWLPPALRAKEPWDTVTQNFGVLFRFN